jgi:nucleotide-binding universal stress UspA family protein
MTSLHRPVLVGYDSSLAAGAALKWAQREAAQLAAPVRAVYVYEWATAVMPVPAGAAWPDPAVRQEVAATIAEAVLRARQARPEVLVTGAVVDGTVTSTLRNLSEGACLLVVGDRGLGGFDGLRSGSVAIGSAIHARCPVVMVRGCAPPLRPVVVGIDDAPDADHAVGFALDHAVSRGVDLVAVRACRPPPVPWRRDTPPMRYDRRDLEQAERSLAEVALQGWREKRPEVKVQVQVVDRSPADALIAASAQAQMVVVGARGRGGFPGQALGSVTRKVLDHAHCPVAVVRHRFD